MKNNIHILTLFFVLVFFGMPASIVAKTQIMNLVSNNSSEGIINISDTNNNSKTPKLIVDNIGNTHVMWLEGNEGSRDLFYSRRINSQQWSIIENISNDVEDVTLFDFAVGDDGKVHVVWRWTNGEPNQNYIYYSQRDLNGTWTIGKQIPGSLRAARTPRIIMDSNNNAHIIWNGGGPGKIYHIQRYANNTWSGITIAASGTAAYNNPKIGIDGNGILHVAWFVSGNTDGNRIRYVQGNPATNIWTSIESLPSGGGPEHDVIVTSDGTVHLLWNSYGSLRYSKRNLNGDWTAYVTLDNSAMDSNFVLDNDEHPYFVWSKNGDIYFQSYSASLAGLEPQNISNSQNSATDPKIVISQKSQAKIVWTELMSETNEIMYTYQFYAGVWTHPKNMSQNIGDSIEPYLIKSSGDQLQLAWSDDTLGDKEIFYLEHDNGAVTNSYLPIVIKE